ncbi:hypothetical protein LIER_28358 [Lithospermum erythrorhizon]|uniref:Reverse transcriptase Ty1/copia-type domain-containing protein n=1 Tax=Lithospermum erythrorhizon TaxID=34254 RepID=A0AAV3RJ05_LITER
MNVGLDSDSESSEYEHRDDVMLNEIWEQPVLAEVVVSPKGAKGVTELVSSGTKPKSFKEAMLYPEWREGIQKEITSFEENGTWKMVELPEGKKALGTQWVYKIKYNSDGSVERCKTQLVVFGYPRVEGIDYNNTFAPVAKMVTIWGFLAVAAVKK